MYDDPSFYSYVPSAYPGDASRPAAKHQRRASLLEPEGSQANRAPLGVSAAIAEAYERLPSPPKATLSRRAQSYTDFHHAARAVLGSGEHGSQHGVSKESQGRRRRSVVAQEEDISDDLSFEGWYQSLESELLEASHDRYREYLEQLKFSESYLGSLSTSTSASLDILSSLTQSFKAVESQTTAFQTQCQGLMTEQKRIQALADDIGENLQYYSYLEPITRRLNAPGAGNFVRGKEFSDMLARLDECLEYLNAHMSQREAGTYRARYRLLLTRGLTLIRVNFVGALKDIAQDVSKRIAEKQLNETTMSALLYAKFRVGASELKEIAQEIKKRAVLPEGAEAGAEAEYQSLMKELYSGYSATRGKLILPLIRKKMGELAMSPNASENLVALTRSVTVYMKGMCSDEHDLWREWFEGEEGLYDFLEVVCEPMFDVLRPRIIHENQLLKLCELCTLLQTRYFRDQDDEIEALDPSKFDFSLLIQSVLEDAQTRLVFRAQAILRNDIEYYRPKPEDLDYPARNRAMAPSGKRVDGPVTSGKKSSVSETARDVGADESKGDYEFGTDAVFRGCYPTLRKAIWLLSRIYRLVNSTVFDDLAHTIVHQTTLSLQRASTALSSRTTATDAQLFLLKHLLLLKQQIVAFDIEYVTAEVSFDFSGVTSTFYELRERGSLFDPRALWRFIGGGKLLPRVVENMLDAKAELDAALRTVINDLIVGSAGRITAPLAEAAAAAGSGELEAAGAVAAVQGLAATEIGLLRGKLGEYMDDRRTRETLVFAVQEQTVQNYETFHDGWSRERRARGATVSRKGKGREGEVWDAGVFGEWAAAAFGVERGTLEGDGGGGAAAVGGGRRSRRLSGGSEEGDSSSSVSGSSSEGEAERER